MSSTEHTGRTMSEADADAMMSWVVGMMEELGITQPEAFNLYIKTQTESKDAV